MSNIIEESKEEFYQMIKDFGSDPYLLSSHVPEAEKWARFILKSCPEADKETVMIAIWLHDIGHYPIPTDIDHAIRGERVAKEFLEKNNFSEEKIRKVLHCIRSHRCKDIMPETIEAKIISCADSASHMTDIIYIDMAKNNKLSDALKKLERDFRDASIFPEVREKLKDLYKAWKNVLKSYERIKI